MRNNYFKTPKTRMGFDSQFEQRKYIELKHMTQKGLIKDFMIQVPLDLICNGYKVCNYFMDFIVVHNDETIELIEMKGLSTPTWALKWKILHAMYDSNPKIKLTVEFQGKGRTPKPTRLPKEYSPQF